MSPPTSGSSCLLIARRRRAKPVPKRARKGSRWWNEVVKGFHTRGGLHGGPDEDVRDLGDTVVARVVAIYHPRGGRGAPDDLVRDPLPRRDGDVVGVLSAPSGPRPARRRRTAGVGDVPSRTSTGVRGEPSERRRLAPPPGWLRHPARRRVGRNRHRRDPGAEEAHLSRTFPAIDPEMSA